MENNFSEERRQELRDIEALSKRKEELKMSAIKAANLILDRGVKVGIIVAVSSFAL